MISTDGHTVQASVPSLVATEPSGQSLQLLCPDCSATSLYVPAGHSIQLVLSYSYCPCNKHKSVLFLFRYKNTNIFDYVIIFPTSSFPDNQRRSFRNPFPLLVSFVPPEYFDYNAYDMMYWHTRRAI